MPQQRYTKMCFPSADENDELLFVEKSARYRIGKGAPATPR